jgi:HD-like signal output (HDOD) protein
VRTDKQLDDLNQIILKLSDPDLRLTDLVAELERFPSLSARIVAASNSVFSGRQTQIQRLGHAIAYLGLRRVEMHVQQELYSLQHDSSRVRAA